MIKRKRISRSTMLLLAAFLISGVLGCKEPVEEKKKEEEEVQAKEEARRLKIEQQKQKAKDLFEKAKEAGKRLKLQESFDMLAEAEKLDVTLEINVKLHINRFGEDLNDYCDKIIKADGPDVIETYYNTNRDPLYISKYCLDFIKDNERFKETTKKRTQEIKETWKRVKYARDAYLRADMLIKNYKRAEGVRLLKELSQSYRDTKWGLAAGDLLIRLGEE